MTPEERVELRRMWKSGARIGDIADALCYSVRTIEYNAFAMGLAKRKDNHRCKVTEEQIEHMRELRRDGRSYGEIVRAMGGAVSKTTVYRYCLGVGM